MHLLTTVTVHRPRLVDALDTLADVALAIEDHADGHRALVDPDRLARDLRAIIADLSVEMAASDLLI